MNLLRTIANWFGYDVIRQSKDILLNRHLHNLFHLHHINCVIDVGANNGQYAQSLRRMGYMGEIHSFEPLEKAFDNISRLAQKDENWHIYNLALGRSDNEMDINVAGYDDFSSLLKPTDYSLQTFDKKSRITHTQRVQIRRIDDVFKDSLKGMSIHLKLDTQGFDLEVFAGATNLLADVSTMQSEISIRQLYEGMPDYLAALQVYRDAGFSISGLFPVTRDKSDLSVIEFDCVMVRTNTPASAQDRSLSP